MLIAVSIPCREAPFEEGMRFEVLPLKVIAASTSPPAEVKQKRLGVLWGVRNA
ncbi:hypothetical protein AVDCRST_MAG81-5034 [uncultured Synechococcales cyanobacterium]|uniref:Uncharacterized protein n=1 Tax=uncultured Synechococcales cyanobacterium TaxID=1936017 RepID=A0A6J4VV53_9CYAN|nr:hypothetical protein AVDCRST_MAG81-5034 [uncultured Synechococcales cyanobacterium]